LYTSLSTPYELAFEDRSAVAQPFSMNLNYRRGPHDSVIETDLRYAGGAALSGFQVSSNATRVVHSEQMFDLKGPLTLVAGQAGGDRVENHSGLGLRDVGVLRRTEAGDVETAWIGELPSGAGSPLQFAAASRGRPWLEQWEERPPTLGAVSLWRLTHLASEQLRLERGEMRLVGWTDDELPGMAVKPRANQRTLRTMVLVHLRPGPLPPPQPDRNTRFDVEASAAGDDELLPPGVVF
jgi:hypothetical protein